MSETALEDDKKDKLQKYLTKGDVADGHRSRRKALVLVPELAQEFCLTNDEAARFKLSLTDFAIEVILGAAWYSRMYRHARQKAWIYISVNSAIVVALPLAVALLGRRWSSKIPDQNTYAMMIAQLSSVLTGVLALQKTASAWYAQQQNYAEWYKCSADLKAIYYDLLTKWSGHVPEDPQGFLLELSGAQSKARHIMDVEREDFYTRLALPSFDALDMMTSSRATVATLVNQLVPSKPTAPPPTNKPAAAESASAAANTDSVQTGPNDTASTDTAAAAEAAPAMLSEVRFLVAAPSLPTFDQKVVDSCARVTLSNSADILGLLNGSTSFFGWYNATFKNVTALARNYPCAETSIKTKRFASFWDQISTAFDSPSITALEFCALMAIGLAETNGDFSAEEGMNSTGPHSGLAYAFDEITKIAQGKSQTVKISYNQPGNRTALNLFKDKYFLESHKDKTGAPTVLNRRGGLDPRWGGQIWPADIPQSDDPGINGFIREADFYKFRGRGAIQTTWRNNYAQLIKWIVTEAPAENSTLTNLATRWKTAVSSLPTPAQQYDAIASISSNDDWQAAFEEGVVPARAVAIYSEGHGGFLSSLSRNASTLSADRTVAGSFAYFAKHVNGGSYPDTVAAMAKALACGVAKTVASHVET